MMPVVDYNDDPWVGVPSIRGIAVDELISALQKYIRRGKTEEAVLVARELWETDASLVEKAWQRVVVIAVEDIGFGNPSAVSDVDTLRRIAKSLPQRSRDEWLMLVHAVRTLAESSKDRKTDDLAAWAIMVLETGKRSACIPDYALDVHTKRGQLAGADTLDFLTRSSHVEPLSETYNDYYKRELIEAARTGEWND